jgi:hypothetical protein
MSDEKPITIVVRIYEPAPRAVLSPELVKQLVREAARSKAVFEPKNRKYRRSKKIR